jgi:hypothetical protein
MRHALFCARLVYSKVFRPPGTPQRFHAEGLEATMRRHCFFAMICALGAMVLALPLGLRTLLTDAPRRAPASLTEVVEIASELGLFHCYDGAPNSNCLVVSESELSPALWEGPRMNNPSHRFWIGTVAIYADGPNMLCNYDPTCSVVWGTLLVYGDPALIEKLTGRRPGP